MSTVYKTTNFEVASGQQISTNVVALQRGAVVAFQMPAALTSTAMTLLACDTPDGTFLDVYTRDATPYSITVAASRYIVIPPADLAGIGYLKIKMGSAEGADRTIKCLVRWV